MQDVGKAVTQQQEEQRRVSRAKFGAIHQRDQPGANESQAERYGQGPGGGDGADALEQAAGQAPIAAGGGLGDLSIGGGDERLDGQHHQVDNRQGNAVIAALGGRAQQRDEQGLAVAHRQVDGALQVGAEGKAQDGAPIGDGAQRGAPPAASQAGVELAESQEDHRQPGEGLAQQVGQ